jgi:hypothetical protein
MTAKSPKTCQSRVREVILQRRAWSIVAFGFCAGFFAAANALAGDVRYPLAIFCLCLSLVFLGIGVCLLSSRLGNFLGRVVMEIVNFFVGAG